jgi:MFS family permease
MGLLWIGHFLSTASLTLLAPLIPIYLAQLGTTDLTWSGVAMAAPAVSYVLIAPVWGRLGDRLGLQWMVVRAAFGLALVLALMGMARTPLQLVALRVCQGAFGGVVDSGTAYASALAPAERRGRVLGVLVTASAAGSVMGPLAGGCLIDVAGFRAVLLGLAALIVSWGLVACLRMPRARVERETGRGDLRPALPFLLAGICANIGLHGVSPVLAPLVAHRTSNAATWIGLLQGAMGLAAIAGSPYWGRRNDRGSAALTLRRASLLCVVAMLLHAVPQPLEWILLWRLLLGFAFSAILQTVLLVVSRVSVDQGTSMAFANSVLVVGQIVGALAGAALGEHLPPGLVFVAMAPAFAAAALIPRRA